MKKKILSVMLVMTLLIGICGVAVAADTKVGATRNSLKSYGSIEYRKGDDKVVINADDLYMLADQIDQVKLDVADQLEEMNTYFTAGDGIALSTDKDINVTHSEPSGSDMINPLSVNFDTMLEGIAASQSVSTDVTDYGYSPGTKLYTSADGSLTTDESEEGATQVTITAATAENLSAGTVAWVNGELILGTGGDNKTYHELGTPDFKTVTRSGSWTDSNSSSLDTNGSITITFPEFEKVIGITNLTCSVPGSSGHNTASGIKPFGSNLVTIVDNRVKILVWGYSNGWTGTVNVTVKAVGY